jgi:hypothetical protein
MRAALRATTPLTVAAMMLLAIVLAITAPGTDARPIDPAFETSPARRCPPGWVEAKPPLNPELGCVSDTIVAATGDSAHPDHCPAGWIPATDPVNHELKCLNNTLTANPTPTPTPCATPNGCFVAIERPIVVQIDPDLIGADDLTGAPCPEGSAIHPAYVEYGCIPYGAGPWAE